MATGPYNLSRAAMLRGDVDLDGTVRAVLLRTSGYTENNDTDEFLSAISGGARAATSSPLASKTFALGTFDSADVDFGIVTSGECNRVALYLDTGVESTSRLLHIFGPDAFSGGAMPFDPAGRQVTLQLPAGGWFRV